MSKEHLVVITGASRGIGKKIAERLLPNYRILNLSRTFIDLEGADHLSVDLSDPQFIHSVKEWLAAQNSKVKQVSLIHNAALLYKDSVQNTTGDQLLKVLQVNVVAQQELNQALLPWMKKGSAIIYIGSTLSEKAVANSFSYVVSKHAVVGMMRATTQDLFHTGIHSCCICPGFTDTEMLRTHLSHNSEVINRVKKVMGVEERLIDPKEIAEVVHFALENPVLNGAVLHANLGQKES